jgi:stage III sporulation protein AB
VFVVLKIIGIAMVIAGSTYYGFFLCFREQSRIKRLKAFRETFILLQGQIRYAYTSMPEAFKHIADKTTYTYIHDFYQFIYQKLIDKDCIDFYEAWNEGMNTYVQDIYFNDKDCEVLRSIGKMPLHLDGDMQILMIDETLHELDNIILEAEDKISQKCKIYKCTGFSAGVVIVLLLA